MAANKQRLTVCPRQAHPGTGDGIPVSHDSEARGFAVRRHGQGRTVLHPQLLHQGPRPLLTIGQFPDWSTTAARARARELRREIDAGSDP